MDIILCKLTLTKGLLVLVSDGMKEWMMQMKCLFLQNNVVGGKLLKHCHSCRTSELVSLSCSNIHINTYMLLFPYRLSGEARHHRR